MTSWTSSDSYDPLSDLQEDNIPDGEARKTVDQLRRVSAEIKKMKKPTGEKDAPGKTCKEIAANADKKLKNGMYWIDPNGGGIKDAIQVLCRFDQKKLDRTQTCILPKTEDYAKKTWFSTRPTGEPALFADNLPEPEFSYGDKSQVKFLQTMARQVKQKIVIRCKNVVTVFDKQNSSYDNAVKLISFDEKEMEVNGKKAYRYRVIEDSCQERNGQWGKTVFEVRGKESKAERLPIIDVGFFDVAGANQEIGMSIGRACFQM